MDALIIRRGGASVAPTPPTPTPAEWVRSPSWPACEADAGDNKIVGLYAVWPGDGVGTGGNFFAMTISGAYTIDFGDGTTTNFTSGSTAYREFDYNNANLANTDAPVTFTASTDTVNRTAHGYSNGMIVQFYNIVTTTGINQEQQYFVINTTANTFQISLTEGGSAVVLTNDGSATLLPYKIATVTIIPQAANNLTSVNLFVKHNQTNLQAYSTGWLDIAIAAPSCTTLTIGSSSTTLNHGYLERVRLNQLGSITSFVDLFYSCKLLQNVVIADTITTVTNMSSMFNGCVSLASVPLFNTASVTSMSSMFFGCSSLISVPLFSTESVTNMSSMFTICVSFTSVPLFNTAAVTSMSSMFNTCVSLASVPLFNTAAVTNMSSMFSSCSSLTSVPLFNTTAVTSMSSMFSSCVSLTSVPLFNTTSVTSMSSMFVACRTLASVPLFNTAAVTSMSSMFNGCVSLTSVPLFNTAAVTSMSSMFNGCFSLTSVPLFNTVSVTDMSSMFNGCAALASVSLFNTAAVTSMSSMFSSCAALASVPLFNTAAVTTMSSMFSSCVSLASVPLFNTAAVTDMSSMFNGCGALTSVPVLVTTAGTATSSFSSMFDSCNSLARIQAKNFGFTFSVANCKLSSTAIGEIYTNLPSTTTTRTITITGNYGVDTATTKSVNTTARSVTVPMASTSGMVVGQFVTGAGTGITTGVSVTSTVTTNILTLTSHGLTNGKRISFATLGTTTGVALRVIYFVVSSTANTFQVALTAGGAAIDLTGSNSTMTIRYPSFITAITTNVSVTLDTPAATTVTSTTLTFRALDSSTALLKGWSVTF